MNSKSEERPGYVYVGHFPDLKVQLRAKQAWDSLTPNQRDIAKEVCKGKIQRDIANERGVILKTVAAHWKRIRVKTGCRDTLDMVQLLILIGEIDLDPWRDRNEY